MKRRSFLWSSAALVGVGMLGSGDSHANQIHSHGVQILICLLVGTVAFTVAAEIYLRFHFAATMPRSPDPPSGRIYRTMAAYGSAVYVNKQELDRVDFVKYDLMSVSGISMLVLFYLKARLKWF